MRFDILLNKEFQDSSYSEVFPNQEGVHGVLMAEMNYEVGSVNSESIQKHQTLSVELKEHVIKCR